MKKPILFFSLILSINILSAQVSMVIGDGGFLFKEGKDSICFYQRTPKNNDGKYIRNNYIHPLYALDGTILTEDSPVDHPHHRGVFWTWHQVYIDGQRMGDPWMLEDFMQKVKNVEFEQLKNGDAIFQSEVEWLSPLWENGKKPYLKELLSMRIYSLDKNYRRIDFEIELKALVEQLSIGGSEDAKGYGGFSVRMKLPEDVSFKCEQKEIIPEVTAVSAGQCVDISGSMGKNNSYAGIAIINTGEKNEVEGKWILRKSKSMQNAVFPGREPIPVKMDKPLTLKYSLLIHDSELNKRVIQKTIKN